MAVDTVEHIGEPHLGINALVLAGREEGVDRGGALGGSGRSKVCEVL